jgi:RNA polymerase sigma factor (sigma-70 family)
MSAELGGGALEAWFAGQPEADDRQVITGLYDTYAAQLFDYCDVLLANRAAAAEAVQDTLVAAAAQIGKLRDSGRLRSWLYCLARRQCQSELPRGAETVTPEDCYAEPAEARSAEFEFEFPDAEAEARDMESLLVITAALNGLSDRDYELVSLVFRHGIEGADLAAVLGLPVRRTKMLLAAASTRFEESADAVMVLRAGWASCRGLEPIAGDWDPVAPLLTPELRKRLSRHISGCDKCTGNRGEQAFGPELLGALPLAVPPAALRERVTKTALEAEPGSYRRAVARRAVPLDGDGFPVRSQPQRNLPRAMAAAAALVVLIVAGAMIRELTAASAGSNTTAPVSTGSPSPAAVSSSAGSLAASKAHAGRRARDRRHERSPGPAGVLPFPTPTPSGLLLSPTPSVTPSPKPTHSKKPSPSPSPTHTSPSPSPSPTSTSPSPSPSTTTTP